MDLESIEQKCLGFLMQASNPLVPFENLVRHLREDESCAEFSEQDLLEFLGKHELFRVFETPGIREFPEATRKLSASGLPVGVHVILCTRIPSQRAVTEMIQGQLGVMTEALCAALAEVREMGDAEAENQLLDALSRAEKLKQMTEGLLRETK